MSDGCPHFLFKFYLRRLYLRVRYTASATRVFLVHFSLIIRSFLGVHFTSRVCWSSSWHAWRISYLFFFFHNSYRNSRVPRSCSLSGWWRLSGDKGFKVILTRHRSPSHSGRISKAKGGMLSALVCESQTKYATFRISSNNPISYFLHSSLFIRSQPATYAGSTNMYLSNGADAESLICLHRSFVQKLIIIIKPGQCVLI